MRVPHRLVQLYRGCEARPGFEHDRRYADELRLALQDLDQRAPDASAADGRVHIHPLDFGRRLVQPPHRSAAYRHVIDIGDQERAVAEPTCTSLREKCVAPGSGNAFVSSAFSAARSRTASGEASVLRRMCTVPTLEIVAPVAASLRPSCLLVRERRRRTEQCINSRSAGYPEDLDDIVHQLDRDLMNDTLSAEGITR